MPGSRQNARPVAGPLLPRLRGGMPALTPSEAQVARYLLGVPQDVVFQSVSEVGQSAGTAASTVVRCAHRLAFTGFQDLRISVQAAVLDLLGSLQRELGLAVLFTTHDLGVVASVAGRVVVLEGGCIREEGMMCCRTRSPVTRASS